MTLGKTSIALMLAAALAPLAPNTVQAQVGAEAQAPQRAFTQAELDQMLAPIALYPDALLSQVLMASTYPIEVVEAARWTRANPNLTGDAAVRAVDSQDWDPSVKSLVAFPQILQRMDEQLSWTQNLGDAFLAQEPAVMDTVQQLRRRAQAAGNLRSSEQIQVVQQGPVIYVRPAAPEVVYVPYYDPLVVYGEWWWPAYRPVYWAPWPGYARAPGVSVGFWFGRPSGVSLNFFFGDVDWGRRHVHVVRPQAYYYRPPKVVVHNTTVINRNVTVERGAWQHDPHHRRGAAYRQPEVRQRYASAQVERRDEQREERRDERKMERRAERPPQERSRQERPERREARAPEPRKAEAPQRRPQAEAKTQVEAKPQAEAKPQPQPQARPVQQHREEAKAPERAEQQKQRAQAQAQRAEQQKQERAQREQQRQRAEPARAQQQPQQRQQAREERKEQREPRREERSERGNGKGGERS